MTCIFYTCGGLGNLLFQHHAAYTHAKDNGLDLYAFSDLSLNTTDRPAFEHYTDLFTHVKITNQRYHIDYEAPDGLYRPIPTTARCIKGYFQCYDYFKKYQWEIRDLLRDNVLFNQKQMKYSDLSKGKITACVHIRRGDYILYQGIFPLVPESYYDDAMSKFKDVKFLVFCEDFNVIQDWDVWKKYDVTVVDEPEALGAFFLMSCCDHFIIANSSMSLMAYYMRSNEDSQIIYPDIWFGPEHAIPFNLNEMVVEHKSGWRNFYTCYINLDHRVDRRLQIEAELQRAGIIAERVRGILPEECDYEYEKIKRMVTGNTQGVGALGCHLSHVKAIENAYTSGKSALIFEDDAVFSSDIIKRLDYIQNFLDNNEWDVFWLSASVHTNPHIWHASDSSGHTHREMQNCHCKLNRDAERTHDPRIFKTYGCFSNVGYIVNYKSIPKILKLLNDHLHESRAIDWLFIRLEPILNTFCFVPGMVTQRHSFSDITNRHASWDIFHELIGPHFFKDNMEDFDPETLII